MFVLYSFALLLVLVLGSPYWIFRMATSGKYREGLSERLGFVPARLRRTESAPAWGSTRRPSPTPSCWPPPRLRSVSSLR